MFSHVLCPPCSPFGLRLRLVCTLLHLSVIHSGLGSAFIRPTTPSKICESPDSSGEWATCPLFQSYFRLSYRGSHFCSTCYPQLEPLLALPPLASAGVTYFCVTPGMIFLPVPLTFGFCIPVLRPFSPPLGKPGSPTDPRSFWWSRIPFGIPVLYLPELFPYNGISYHNIVSYGLHLFQYAFVQFYMPIQASLSLKM